MPQRLDFSDVTQIHLDPHGKSWLRIWDRKQNKEIFYRVNRWVAQLAKNEAKHAEHKLQAQLRDLLGAKNR